MDLIDEDDCRYTSSHHGHNKKQHDQRAAVLIRRHISGLGVLTKNIRTVELIVKVPTSFQLCQQHFKVQRYENRKYGCDKEDHETHFVDSNALAELEQSYQSVPRIDSCDLLYFPLELKGTVDNENIRQMEKKFQDERHMIEEVGRNFMFRWHDLLIKNLRQDTNVELRWVPFKWNRRDGMKKDCDWFSMQYLRALHDRFDMGSEKKVRTAWLDSLGRSSPPVEN